MMGEPNYHLKGRDKSDIMRMVKCRDRRIKQLETKIGYEQEVNLFLHRRLMKAANCLLRMKNLYKVKT